MRMRTLRFITLDRRRRGSTTKTNRAARAGLGQQPALEGSEARLQRERRSPAARQRALRESVLDAHAAAQPDYVFRARAALHCLPARVAGPVLLELIYLVLVFITGASRS